MGYIATSDAPVAQLDRVPDYESGGHRFESCLVYQANSRTYSLGCESFFCWYVPTMCRSRAGGHIFVFSCDIFIHRYHS
jgi:hypothetical protein